jgi:Alcohol dehydrogenase transcription factor Myb/SANT-like
MIKFHEKPKPEQVNDVELIEEVKTREFLYKNKHECYRNLPMRTEAWGEIANKLGISDCKLI